MGPHAVREAYGAMAQQYIALFDGEWDAHEADAGFLRRHLGGARGRVLDLGCGPGHWSAYLHGLGVEVTGVDLVPAFVAHARAAHPGIPFAVGDLDGDGGTDLVAIREDGSLLTFAGDGNGFVTRDTGLPAPDWRTGCAGTHVRLADIDHDRTDEIVATFAGEPDVGSAAAGTPGCASGGGVQVWKVTSTRR